MKGKMEMRLTERALIFLALSISLLCADESTVVPVLPTAVPSVSKGAERGSPDDLETIVIFRHGEKPSPAVGMLSETGFQRALSLPDILVSKYGIPTHLFAPNPSINKFKEGYHGEPCCYVRALLTIAPIAVKLKLPINTDFGMANGRGLQDEIEKPEYHRGTIFIAWEHVGCELIARRLLVASGGNGAEVPKWPSSSPDQYDVLYVVRIQWHPDGTRSATFCVDHENVQFAQGKNGK